MYVSPEIHSVIERLPADHANKLTNEYFFQMMTDNFANLKKIRNPQDVLMSLQYGFSGSNCQKLKLVSAIDGQSFSVGVSFILVHSDDFLPSMLLNCI